jgi:hypothetical protein
MHFASVLSLLMRQRFYLLRTTSGTAQLFRQRSTTHGTFAKIFVVD